jgi:NitT/TauT family transport system substrate-binding protein
MSLKLLKQLVLLSAGAMGLLLPVIGLTACDQKMETIRFGAIPSGSAALIYIAQEQGFSENEGISIIVKDYPTGFATTDALLKGEVDIAWAAEFPMVHRAFAKEKISIIAVSSRFSDQYLFARKDRGIERLSDLKGKKIGVPRNTIAEFYLARFLELSGLNMRDITLANVLPPQSIGALTGGDLDGVVTWEPFTSQIKALLGDKVALWPVQSSQPGYGVMIARNDWIKEHPALTQRFLTALVQAEGYLVRNPEASRDIVKKQVNYDDALMQIFWSENQFSLFLDQSLILAMEDEARWMIMNKLTDKNHTPDFLEYLHIDALSAIKPGTVHIIR